MKGRQKRTRACLQTNGTPRSRFPGAIRVLPFDRLGTGGTPCHWTPRHWKVAGRLPSKPRVGKNRSGEGFASGGPWPAWAARTGQGHRPRAGANGYAGHLAPFRHACETPAGHGRKARWPGRRPTRPPPTPESRFGGSPAQHEPVFSSRPVAPLGWEVRSGEDPRPSVEQRTLIPIPQGVENGVSVATAAGRPLLHSAGRCSKRVA